MNSFSVRLFPLWLTLALASHGSETPVKALIEPAPSTTPSRAQQAQMDRKYGMFCHFGLNTFANEEWTDGTKPATMFAPTAIDADQWVKTAKAAGMKYFLLTTKHHDGFCLWDSKATTYDVATSAVPKADVVRLVADACKRHGIAFAVYYSLWDRNWDNGVMRATKNDLTDEKSAAYFDYMKQQLTELLTGYGPVAELWLDGGWIHPREDWHIPELYHHVKSLQPDCQFSVNWTVGVDSGNLQPVNQKPGDPFRYFPCDFRTADPYMPKFPDPKTFTHNGKTYYLPFEATVTISGGTHWFYHTADTTAKPLSFLEKSYNTATAQGNLLVINAAPTRDGVLLPSNVKALTDLAHRLGLEPGRPHPVNLANSATVTASSTWAAPGYEAANACDENPDTRWSAAAGDLTPSLEIAFSKPTRFDRVIVNEYGEKNNYHCTSFEIQTWNGKDWTTCHTGTTLGESCRIDLPRPVTTGKLRLRILKSTSPVSLWMLKVQDSKQS